MVSKKNNKISPKDINLLLKKLIIIIKKISNSCGNKKKRVGGAWPGVFGKSDKPNLNEEIHDFLLNNFNKSKAFFRNISTDYFKKDIKNYFSKDKINLTKKDNFHDQQNIQYNKRDSDIIKYVNSNKTDILSNISSSRDNIYLKRDIIITKDSYIIFFDDTPPLPGSKIDNIGYIVFNNMDDTTINKNYKICYDYYKLNKKLFDKFNKSVDYDYDISDEDIKIIKSYIKLIGDKNKTEEIYNYPKQDTLETFFYYINYITKIDVDDDKDIIDINKKDIIDINKLKNLQKKCGKTDKYLLKHAVIYNIGVMLESIQYIISESDD